MFTEQFNYPPSVELLEYLSPNTFQNLKKGLKEDLSPKTLENLKENLFKAVRLWVIIYSLYGESSDLNLDISLEFDFKKTSLNPPWFKKADWENQIIYNNLIPGYQKTQKTQKQQDYRNSKIYQLDIKELLFNHNDVEEEQWRESFKKHCQINDKDSEKILGQTSNDEDSQFKNCPFAISLRSISNTFKTLSEKGWLDRKYEDANKKKTKYRKVEDFSRLLPNYIISGSTKASKVITESIPNLISWLDFLEPINGKQRFFIDLENIVSEDIEDIYELEDKLKLIWNLDPVPPVKLTYRSAKQYQDEFECIVYPVCLYQIKRAPYLFAYGTTPQNNQTVNWYDYRVDKIKNIKQLKWTDEKIPPDLVRRYQNKTLFEPDYVQEQIESALGYDFYQPKADLILKFDPYFHSNYIEGTERDKDFFLKQIKHQLVINEINKAVNKGVNANIDKKLLLSKLETKRYQNAIYCKVKYFVDDNNVIMRLRAWCPNVEVILPWQLRQRMKEDIEKTWRLYE